MSLLKKLGERNYELIRHGVKSSGSYDPNICFCYFEERLYVDEMDTIKQFLSWVNEDDENRCFGSGNYEQRFQEFIQHQNSAKNKFT